MNLDDKVLLYTRKARQYSDMLVNNKTPINEMNKLKNEIELLKNDIYKRYK